VRRYSLHVNFDLMGNRSPLDAHVPVVLDKPFKVSHTTDDGIDIEVSGTVSSPRRGRHSTTIAYCYGRRDRPVHRRHRGTAQWDLTLGEETGRGVYVSDVPSGLICVTLSEANPLDAGPSHAADAVIK
jgi:hypothetical protein